MIELTIRKTGESERKVLLKGGAYTMGRHEDNDIVLDDKEVSRRHARLLVDRDSVVLEDLGSGNGTFVGGKAVSERPLRDGDHVEIEPFTLQLRFKVQKEAKKVPTLVVTEGASAGRRFPLSGDSVTIGRGDDQDVQLDDTGASRAHAVLLHRRAGWFVRDLDSANGVFVNGQRIAEAPVEPGDVVEIGTTSLRLDVLPERAHPAAGRDIDVYLEDGPTDVDEAFETAPTKAIRPAPPVHVPVAPVAPAPVVPAPVAAPVVSAPVAPVVAQGGPGDVLPYVVLSGLVIAAVAVLVTVLMLKGA